MIYLLLLIFLFVAELIYFRIADKYNIIDKPNERSSHTKITLRGGGVIFWVAAVLYVIFNFSNHSLFFLVGITLIALVSFWDDVSSLNQKVRLAAHLFAMTFAFYFVGIFGQYPWWMILIGYILFIGIVNAYNFMDGINGITGLYTLAVLLPLMYVNYFIQPFVDSDFLRYPFLAAVVFLFFNFRTKAKCFAGDVGSVSIAFWIVTLLIMLIIKTNSLIWIGFLFIYGVDSVLTILHRIYLKQNILEAHRLHFYQILANEKRMSHLLVSVFYFIAQLICSALIIWFYPVIGWWIVAAILIILIFIYLLKFK